MNQAPYRVSDKPIKAPSSHKRYVVWSCKLFGHRLGKVETILSAGYAPPGIVQPTMMWYREMSKIQRAMAGEEGWWLMRVTVQRCLQCDHEDICVCEHINKCEHQ